MGGTVTTRKELTMTDKPKTPATFECSIRATALDRLDELDDATRPAVIDGKLVQFTEPVPVDDGFTQAEWDARADREEA